MGTPNFMGMLPDFLQKLRLGNIFNQPMANDLPSQGGFGGNMGGPMPMPDIGSIFGGNPGGDGPPRIPTGDIPFINDGRQPMLGDMPGGFPEGFGPTPQAPPLFNPSPMQTNMPVPPESGGGGGLDRIAKMMQDLYQPQTEAGDRFSQLQSEYPEYQKPNWWKVAGASLADFIGGPGAGMPIVEGNRPYKLADWKNKIGPAQQAANLERQENVNSRTTAYQTISQTLRAEADEARAQKNEKDALIRQQRADVYEFKARNPNLKLIMTKGGNVMAFNPADGSTKDTGIPTGSLTEADKMSMTQENMLERIEATGEQQRQTEGVRQGGRQDIAETRGWKPYEETLPDGTKRTFMYNEVTGETRDKAPGGTPQGATPVKPGGNSGGRTELPTQTKVRQYNSARELVNTRPDLAKHIRLGPGTNEFRITQPGKNFWGSATGPSNEEVAEIETAIYGAPISQVVPQPTRTGKPITTGVQNTPDGNTGRPPVTNSGPTTSAAERVGKAPTLPKGAVIPPGEVVIAKDGKIIGTVRQENAAQAEKEGYQIVRQ